MTLQYLAEQEYPCLIECCPPYAPRLGCCPTCKIAMCRSAFIKGMTKQGERAMEQFEDAITQLVLDYGITDEVAEGYCEKFDKALYH